MKKIVVFLFVSMWWSYSTMALTIDEAVEIAIENSNRIERSTALKDSQAARVESQKSQFWPALDLAYSFTRQEEDIFFGTKNTSSLSAIGSYNLFNGFIDKNILDQERHLLDATTYEESGVRADVILEARRAFLEVLKVAGNVDAAREGVELLERQQRDSSLRFREGLIAKNELLRVEVELSSARFILLQTESNLKVARERLTRVLGQKLGSGEPLEVPLLPQNLSIDRDELRAEMFKRRSEVKFLDALIMADTSEKDSIEGEYWPALDILLTYRTFGDSLVPDGREGLFLTDTELSGTLLATWNLFEGFKTKNDIIAQEKEIIARQEELKDLKKELDFQLEEAIEKYRISSGQMEVTKDSIEQAEETLRITNNQYKESIATLTDLLDARVSLTRARVESNTAFYNLMISVADIGRVIEDPSFGLKIR